MKKYLLVYFIMLICPFVYGQREYNGIYVGLEEMCAKDSSGRKYCYNDPSNPRYKWYYLSTLKINGDSAFLEQSPISIFKNDTLYSSSSGGFYYYSGLIEQTKESLITINLTETSCDYCGELVEKLSDGTFKRIYRTKRYHAKTTSKGLLIEEHLFKKK